MWNDESLNLEILDSRSRKQLRQLSILEVSNRMKKMLFSLLGLALTGSVAVAEVPDEGNCTVQPADALNGLVFSPLLPTPSPASVNTITVRNGANAPINNATVVVQVGANTTVCGATVLTGVTNAAGQVVLTLGGGGCAHNVALSGLVKANGVTIRSYANVKSPDYDGSSGNLSVGLQDLVQFSGEFLDNFPNECHDYNNDGNTGLEDVIIFGGPFTGAASCAP
jgi:hypothetical protein